MQTELGGDLGRLQLGSLTLCTRPLPQHVHRPCLPSNMPTAAPAWLAGSGVAKASPTPSCFPVRSTPINTTPDKGAHRHWRGKGVDDFHALQRLWRRPRVVVHRKLRGRDGKDGFVGRS